VSGRGSFEHSERIIARKLFMDRGAHTRTWEYAKEGGIRTTYPISVIDGSYSANHALEQLIGKRSFAARLVAASSHLTEAALHFPNGSHRNEYAYKQSNRAPKPNRTRCPLFSVLDLLKNTVLLLWQPGEKCVKFIVDGTKLCEAFYRVPAKVLGDVNIRLKIFPKLLPLWIV
jgi:hypothetical protein